MAAKSFFSILIGIVLFSISTGLGAQFSNEVREFDDAVFEYHFDRADRELSPESWLWEARKGVEYGIAAWEKTIWELYADPALAVEALGELTRWSNEELERRYTEWLFGRFFGVKVGETAHSMDETIEYANHLYAFHNDGEGNVLYDESGDPDSIRPYEGRSVESDIQLWNQLVFTTGEAEIEDYRLSLASAFPELLSIIERGGADKTDFENRLSEVINNAILSRRSEFEALLAREERLFTARRTGDLYSLRKESEQESALAISSRLIRDAENYCATGIASLEEKIEAARADPASRLLAGEEWFSVFEEQFEKGLAAWTGAEERFIVRRMEWERDSGERFTEGIESWKTAFTELEKERLAWENKAGALFKTGEQLFSDASEKLDAAIVKAKEEFQKEAASRVSAGKARAEAMAETYLTCVSVATEASKSVEYWLSRFVPGAPADGLENGTLSDWVTSELEQASLGEVEKTAGGELLRWATLYSQYKERARESFEKLEQELRFVLDMDGKALNAVLDSSSEEFFLDEYQLELLRSKAVAEYWEQRLAIAEAVSAYAEELSAGRMTEAESLAQWRASKASYDSALRAYEAIQKQLTSAGFDLALIQEALQNASDKLGEEERKLSDLNNRYSLQMAAYYKANSGEFIQAELASFYETLTQLVEKRRADNAYYTAALTAEKYYYEEYALAEAWALLQNIVQSEVDKDERAAQLSSLREKYDPESEREAVLNARRSLNGIFAKLGLDSAETIPDAALIAGELFRRAEEEKASPAFVCASLLLRIDEAVGILPAMAKEEIDAWKETFLRYMAAKTLHDGIAVPEDVEESLVEYEKNYSKAIELYDKGEDYLSAAREASFHQYMFDFLVSYDTCLCTSNAVDKKKQWQSYVEDLSAEEGIVADTYDTAKEAARKMSEAFELIASHELSERQQEFLDALEAYRNDLDKAWKERAEDPELSISREVLMEESEKLQNDIADEDALKEEIANLGFTYEQLPPSGQAALNELNAISEELEKVKLEHQSAFDVYKQKADTFSAEGARYEAFYRESKQLFDEVESARIAYEKQDAVQRWAGTAYLNNSGELSKDLRYYREPAEELAYARERNDRAQIALAALAELYHNNETSRLYANEEYRALYEEYRESFSRMFLTLKAKTEFAVDLEEELERNREHYFYLSEYASSFASPEIPFYYDEYMIPTLQESSWIDFIKITETGDLALSRDKDSFILIQPKDTAVISSYFKNKSFSGNGASQMSAFEEAIASWAIRMESYNLENSSRYRNWGLALDYITRSIIESNPEIGKLAKSYTLTEMGSDGKMELDGDSLNSLLRDYRRGKLKSIQKKAWDNLSGQQQHDLEFLAFLYLSGGGGEGASGLDKVSEYMEMNWLYNEADYYDVSIKIWFFWIPMYRWPYSFDPSELYQVFGAVRNRRRGFQKAINSNRVQFSSGISELASKAKEFHESCKKLSVLSVQRESGIVWSDIETVLPYFEENEKERLRSYWEEMIDYKKGVGENSRYTSILPALDALYTWGKEIRDTLEQQLTETYASNEDDRFFHQNKYRTALDAFINGEASLDELNRTARLAYGNEAASLKAHLNGIGITLIADLTDANADREIYADHYRDLSMRYAGLIEEAYNARLLAELSGRSVYWNEQRKDLTNKLASWREASSLILERGRQDWKDGTASMQTSFEQWKNDFSKQYANVDAAWNVAYLESLNNKEKWVNQVLKAASVSLDTSLLAMVGSDAESFSRTFDNFIPSALPGYNAAEETGELLRTVLNSAGITKMYQAFEAASGNAKTVSTVVTTGISGLGLWDSGQARVMARDFAQTSTATMAEGKAKILAFNARESIYNAKKSLEDKIAQSNKSIDNNIDELFTMNGGWIRSGNNYIKEIVVHSTFFKSAITDTTVLNSYRFFVLDYWDLVTDLSDANLEHLNHFGLRGIIAMAEEEIKEKTQQVFGDGNTEGEFDVWVGAAPLQQGERGTGEIGRLLYEFNKWEGKQAKGISAMNAPLWDKPLWDSRDSWFSAPSLRSAVDTITSIASTVVGAMLTPITAGGGLALTYGMNMLDDLFFNTLDVANGYKDWSEFGMTMGKKALLNVAATAGKAVFKGISQTFGENLPFADFGSKAINSTSTAGTGNSILGRTAMSSVEALSTGTLTSAVGAIDFSSGNFGWNWDNFKSGMKNSFINAAVAGTGVFTTETMNLGLEGFYGNLHYDGVRLSSLAGGLAGQGMSYALGGDITINALNLGSFSQKMDGLGLVELHFGRDGFGGNFGTGGVDVSLRTLAGASRGLEAWKVNFDILASGSKSARDYASQMRTLYSGGNTEKTLYDSILANETMIAEDRTVEYTKTVYDPVIGKTIVLGNDAINDESRFGLNVVFSHEAYRDGIVDGIAGQRQETNMAVMGHVSTALGLSQTYGEGVLGEAMTSEAKKLADTYDTLMSGTVSEQEKMEVLASLGTVLGGYDSSGDYWRMQHNGTLVSDGTGWLRDERGAVINRNGSRSFEITKEAIGAEDPKTGLLKILFGGNTFSQAQIEIAEHIMKSAGLTKNGAGRRGLNLSMDYVMCHAGNTVFYEVFDSYYNNTIDYYIANHHNVDLIFNKKGNWRPNTVYANSSERYTELFNKKYGGYSRDRLVNTLKTKYLQTMVTDEGRYVNMLKISEDNPYISKILNQNDPAFVDRSLPYYNYALWQWGCNFMSTIAIPQLLTGNVLNAREITDVWNWAAATENSKHYDSPYNRVVTGTGNQAGNVNDADMLANHVLQDVFGYKYHSLTFNRGSPLKPKANGITNLVALKEQYYPTHFVLNSTDFVKIYDPWPYINRTRQRYDGVVLDIRRPKNGSY